MSQKAGRGSDQFVVRLPEGMREQIKAYADKSGRSMNQEIVRVLDEHFPSPPDYDDILDAIEKLIVHDPNLGDGESRRKIWTILDELLLKLSVLEQTGRGGEKITNLVWIDDYSRSEISRISKEEGTSFENVLSDVLLRGLTTYGVPSVEVKHFADSYSKKKTKGPSTSH
ncbi:MAG: arc-like binding domain protein [Proteobacteria bacterium]|nr:arc-like binding domain protein [Pseudomonadota bacterium]